MYHTEEEKFHWNLPHIVEFSGGNVSTNDGALETACPVETTPQNKEYSYDLGSLVAVREHDDDDSLRSSIGRVEYIHYGQTNVPYNLSVQWLEIYNVKSKYNGRFRELLLRRGETQCALIDQISVDAILVSFQKLTSAKTLPSYNSRYLQKW